MIDFEFSLNRHKIPLFTVALHSMKFNIPCVHLLNSPDYINIGFNKNEKLLVIKAADKSDDGVRKYPFLINRKKKQLVHICSAKIIKEVLQLITLVPGKHGINYLATFDSPSQMLFVDLTKPLTFF